ncbi:MAG: lamin tail domain-containing protein [bacterium]|nr:lamin tail domain-containing protein [bacterium]
MPLATLLAATTLLSPQSPDRSESEVVINEFSYDDSGSNDRVFVELFNRTQEAVDISGWTIEGVDGTSTGNGSVTIPANVQLGPGTYYVIGQAAGVPNVDLDVPSMPTVLETGADGLVLKNAGGEVVDGVAWEMANWTNPVPFWLEGDGLWGDVFNNDLLPQSASRKFDGADEDDNGCDFRIMAWSPGTSNEAGLNVGPVLRDQFDTSPGTPSSQLTYSFAPLRSIDPLGLGVPASPQGGNCAVFDDSAGGGNVAFLASESREDWLLECYVYLRGPEPTFDSDDVEAWGIGIRGTSDSFAEFPDVDGLHSYLGTTSNLQTGMTGLAFYQVITQSTSRVFLVDFNNGGGDANVLAGPIAIANPGWTRLRLSAIGNSIVMNLGGTLGCDDGNRSTATGVFNCSSGVYLQYRENVTGSHRPALIDNLIITANRAPRATYAGFTFPTSAGHPQIFAGSQPWLGNSAFSIKGAQLVPGSFSFTMINLGIATMPGVQISGAPIGARVFINNLDATVVLHTNSATGSTVTTVPIPCDSLLTGLPFAAQIFDVDLSLPTAIPLGTSRGLALVVGN